MPFFATLPPAIVATILGRLALLFLTGADDDLPTARHAAAQMLAAYQPENEDELRLAAKITSFSFHALEALSQANTPDLPRTNILRLRGSAVSLSRESHKAQRRLDQLQKARRAGTQARPEATKVSQPAAKPTHPQIDGAIASIQATRQAIETAPRNNAKTWTQSYNQRMTANRIAGNLKKHQAAHAAAVSVAASSIEAASPAA